MTIQEKLFRNALKGSKKYFDLHGEEALDLIDNRDIEEYARWHLYMIEEDEANEKCDCERIEDADADDLLYELERKGIKLQGDNIVTSDLVNRFAKIVQLDDPIKLTGIIEQLEKENNLS